MDDHEVTRKRDKLNDNDNVTNMSLGVKNTVV